MFSKLTLTLFLTIMLLARSAAGQPNQLQKITITYQNRSGAIWPLFIASEGGYYRKNGLDVNLVFGVPPAGITMLLSGQAQMVISSLQQIMPAVSIDGSLVMVASSLNKGMLSLIARPDIISIRELRGKRIAISQLGDGMQGYTIMLLGRAGLSPRDVEWMAVGPDVSRRVAALTSKRVDAALLTVPASFKLEDTGYRNLANLADYDEVFASTADVFKKSVIAANPKLPELLIKAHAEAIKRFYDDKAFAVKAYLAYDNQQIADVQRAYDLYAKAQAFERIPYVLAGAVHAIVEQQSDPQMAARMNAFDFRKVVDNGIVDRLVHEGFFLRLFGTGIDFEEHRKAGLALR